jgi:uncharacterized membrane protein
MQKHFFNDPRLLDGGFVMRFRNLDLIIAMFIVMLNIAWTQVPYHLVIVGILLALPLIFFLPGYTITQTLFRRRSSENTLNVSSNLIQRPELKIGHPISGTDQLLLSFGLSMAVAVLVGFVLNILPVGLEALSWVLSLGLITLTFAMIAAILRREDIPAVAKPLRVFISLQDCIFFTLALLVIASVVWFTVGRPLQPQSSFTQLWMLPVNQTNKACAVSIGVQSFESSDETYRVVVSVNKTQINAWSSIELTPQQKWVQTVPVPSNTAGSLYIEAQLYKADKPDVAYRNVHLTFYVSSINNNGHVQQQCVFGIQK